MPSRDEMVENAAIECNGVDDESTNEMHSMFGAQVKPLTHTHSPNKLRCIRTHAIECYLCICS